MKRIRQQRPTEFHRVFVGRVGDYFKRTGIKKRDNGIMYAKGISFLALAGVSYPVLVFFSVNALHAVLAAVSLWGALLFGFGFCIQHDGNHEAISKHYWINRLGGFTLDLVGTSSYVWKHTHNLQHHAYTNLPHHDGDMEYSRYVRLSHAAPLLPCHRYQHVYVWGIYALAHLSFVFVDIKRLFTHKGTSKAIPFPSGSELVLFVAGKILYYGYTIVVPLWFHPWYYVLGTYVTMSMCLGLAYQLVAQSAHMVEIVDHPQDVSDYTEREFIAYQLGTSASFGPESTGLTSLLGGLNNQAFHHVFPGVCHVHFVALWAILRQTCEEFGVRYRVFPSFFAALRFHYCFLKAMGRA